MFLIHTAVVIHIIIIAAIITSVEIVIVVGEWAIIMPPEAIIVIITVKAMVVGTSPSVRKSNVAIKRTTEAKPYPETPS